MGVEGLAEVAAQAAVAQEAEAVEVLTAATVGESVSPRQHHVCHLDHLQRLKT
jgi:hypothetical protein